MLINLVRFPVSQDVHFKKSICAHLNFKEMYGYFIYNYYFEKDYNLFSDKGNNYRF